jgi:RNA polymerase sigma-70 factor, ECF subfamily
MADDAARTHVVTEIARHQARLRGFLRCLLVRPSDVDDLLQEINATLWEKAEGFEPGTDFWAWASQVARYKAFNQIRRYGRERLVFDDTLLGQLAETASEKLRDLDSRRTALDHCLERLSPPQRQLLELRYTAGQSVETIAQSIGRPAGSLRQTLYRIRVALQSCIEGQLALSGEGS